MYKDTNACDLAGGVVALNWFVSITSASFFINWMIVAFTSWRFHKVIAAQDDQLFSGLYAWKSTMWPLAPVWLMTVCTLLLICCVYVGAKPPVRQSLRPMEASLFTDILLTGRIGHDRQ